jgi:pilus assembly protein CpaF
MENYNFNSVVKCVRDELGIRLDLSRDMGDDEIREAITNTVIDFSRQNYINLSEKQHIIATVFNSLRRLDIIQPLLDDPSVTEIMINSADEIFIEKDGFVQQLDIRFENTERLENVIQSIVSKVNRIVNESSPIVDARLNDGSRVNIVLPPIALKGPTMTIRKFSKKPFTIERMCELGSITEEATDLLKKLVRAKYNIFVSGGTGSGKSTFLNALSGAIPGNERIVTIEDSAELQIKNINNLVSLETRNVNSAGKGEVTIRDLIKTSLRMRPDRIIVGEVRGAEALDMLQAMNTGHDGSLSTGHANSTIDMFSRLETMVLSGALLPLEVIRKQIAAALDIVVHLGRLRDGFRRVLEISEVIGCSDGEIELNPLYLHEDDGRSLGTLKATGNQLKNCFKLRMAGMSAERKGDDGQ